VGVRESQGADLNSLDGLRADVGNAPVIALLEAQASLRPPWSSSEWAVDEYMLHVHPDLIERVETVTTRIPKAALVPVYGCVVSAKRGAVFAVAMGMRWVAIRVPANELDVRLEPVAATDLGPEWSEIDCWMSDVPSPLGNEILADAFRQAADAIPGKSRATGA
jgi:hypothetical protein